ncbi:MAG: hypothetical protein JNJ83_22500 [Verrucomicrobiaceae bacterium]|nr:hypothetical protein [Verrucomicrobiaceae bacterium]
MKRHRGEESHNYVDRAARGVVAGVTHGSDLAPQGMSFVTAPIRMFGSEVHE